MLRGVLRVVIRLVLLAVLVLAGFVAWGLFWPRPGHPPRTSCFSYLSTCRVVAGRVVYHTTFASGRRAHIVLLSRSSVTLPGIVTAEFPAQLARTPAGLGLGDWVSIAGSRMIGSHHEHDIHISSFATAAVSIRCGVYNSVHLCTPTNRWPGLH